MNGHPIERFDPLLRNVLSWGLVERADDGTWQLSAAVQSRLAQLAELTQRPETAAVVFFGHTCARCRMTGATRLLEGRYVCDACRRQSSDATPATPVAAEPERRWPGSRHRGRRLAS